MTQQPEAIPQAAPPSRVTPPFTVIIGEPEYLSRDTGSKKFTGTLGNGKPTHAFTIMANRNFPASLQFQKDNAITDTGIVMLTVHQLQDDGKTPGKLVLAWEKNITAEGQDSEQTAEFKTAILSDLFDKFHGGPRKKPVEEKPADPEEIDQPAAKL